MNKQIYITGGANGIGLQLAKDYVSQGADVALFDIQATAQAVAQLAARARPQQQISGHALDVTCSASVTAAFAEVAAKRPPDLLIHCAGIVSTTPFVDLPEQEFVRIITVNLLGTRHVAAAAIPLLKPGGQLVLMASMAGLIGCYGYSAYGASKHGVIGLAEVLRLELKSRGIDVAVVCPPEVETPMVQEERKHRSKATESMKLLAGTLSVEHACEQIRDGIAAREFLIIPGQRARWLWASNKLLPGVFTRWLSDRIVRQASGGTQP